MSSLLPKDGIHRPSSTAHGDDTVQNECILLRAKVVELNKRLSRRTREMYNMSLTEAVPQLKRQIEFLRKENKIQAETIKRGEDSWEVMLEREAEIEKYSKRLALQEKKQILVQQDIEWKNKMLLEKLEKYKEAIDIIDGISDTAELEIERDGALHRVSWINKKICERKTEVLDKIALRTRELDASIMETTEAIKILVDEYSSKFWDEGVCFSEITEEQKERFWRHRWLFNRYSKNNPNDPDLLWDATKNKDLKYCLRIDLLWSKERLNS